MIPFNKDELFPALPEGSHTYGEAQIHSAKVDQYLGLKTEEIEKELTQRADLPGFKDQQLWIGLPPKKMLTPYTEIRTLLEELKPGAGARIMDLGAGYGRMGFVVGHHYPEVLFTGIEYVRERVAEAKRVLNQWNFKNINMRVGDLSSADFKLKSADFYFIYDYGTSQAIEKTLADLKEIAQKQIITVIGRGRLSRDTIERNEPWLSQVVAPRHFAHYSIYRSG